MHASHDFADEIESAAADQQGLIKSELEPGERLLWSARPVLKPFRVGGGVILSALMACGSFAALLLVFANRQRLGEGVVTPVGWIAFVVAVIFSVGVLTSLNRERHQRASLSRALYALTDRRAIIWSPGPSSGSVKVVSVPRGSVAGVHRVQLPDGSGDVVFRNSCAGFQLGEDYFAPTESGFFGVAEVRRVEEQVRRTLLIPPAGGLDSDDHPNRVRQHPAGESL